MKNKIKLFVAGLLFGKPKVMSVYKDKDNNFYGSVIHEENGKSYVHVVNKEIGNNEYVGETSIWI